MFNPLMAAYLARQRGLPSDEEMNVVPMRESGPDETGDPSIPSTVVDLREPVRLRGGATEQVRDPALEQAAAQVEQQRPATSMFEQRPEAPPEEDDGLWQAQEADRKSRLTAGMELAARQLVGGITQTPVGQGIGAAPSQVPMAMKQADARKKAIADEIARKRQGVMDDSTLRLRESEIAKNMRPPPVKPDKAAAAADELESYKKVMIARYPEETYPGVAALFRDATSMKVAQDLQNSLDAQRGQDKGLDAAKYNASVARTEAERVREAAKEDAAKKRAEDQARDLANEMKGRGVMKKRMGELVATIPKVGAVPGTGVLGDAVAWLDSKAGTDFQSPEAVKVRQNIGLLMAAILREQSGATVSEQEYARAVQNGLSTKNAATTRAALKRLEEEFAVSEAEIRRKYPKEALDVYESRAGAQPAAGKPSPGPGYVRGNVNGKPGWVNKAAGEWEPD